MESILRNVESSVPKAGSETLEDVYNRSQQDEVPAMALSNESNTKKGTTLTTTPDETLETKEVKHSSRAICCFGTSIWDKMTPKCGWRKMACTIVAVAVLAVMNLSVCSLPTVIYLIAPVSVLDLC